jgi:hypothetical protein
VNELTPAVLRGDTRVTNHGFTGGRANPLQQVLQAGTAVLVDRFGVPRTRCACGNPLTEPKAASGTVTYRGPRWPGFSPRTIVVVQPSATVIDDFTFVDVITGDPFTRPAGTEGDSDSAGAPPTIPTPLPEPTAGSPTAPPSPGVTPEPTEAEIPIEGTYSMTLEGLRGDCGEVTEEGSDTIRIVVHSLPTDSSDGSATLRSEGDPIELVLQPGLYFEGGGEGGTISGRFEAAGGTTVIQAEVNFAGCTFRWSGERTGD